MYDYLIATDEGLAQSIPENSEKEENGGTNAKEDAELLGEDSENEKDEDSEMEKDIDSEMEKDIDSEMEKDIDSEMEDDSEDFDLEDSSEPEKENEDTQTDEYNVSRGIDFESFLFSPLLLLSRRGCRYQLFNACLRFALRSPHWPNGASWKSGYASLLSFTCRHGALFHRSNVGQGPADSGRDPEVQSSAGWPSRSSATSVRHFADRVV